MNRPVRTRFAPSPTGYLHVGGARTALYSWAYARKHGGTFILRIEDTDIERSTQASIDAILDGMGWLGLDWDSGPFYQMKRLERYAEVARQLIESGHAYWCYASKEELDAMRGAQRAAGLKPRYDGRWRPENAAGKALPAGVKPVLRFRNPDEGTVAWDDLVKGRIEIANGELDDLVLLRADGVPTYNFGVVVDDLDMAITHCIRGDDHVNNTPRQINIYRAMGAAVPAFAHVPMILGSDGERLSKRHGAVSVMQYAEDGFLPEALLNYLARLGWSHGNDEVFSLERFVEWFDLEHISRSPAQFNPEKLSWLNQQYIKVRDDHLLAEEVAPRLSARGIGTAVGPALAKVVALYKDRVATLNELADAAEPFYVEVYPGAELLAQHVTDAARAALKDLRNRLSSVFWERAALNQALKDTVAAHGMKLPQLAIPLRVVLTGQPQTPSIDAVLEAFGRDIVLARLSRHV
ncbi:MAG: glutamate--tRNA ligase [Rhodocyclaceae bacterium]|jgi:glutamyl-tRNA synthetase|nr:glutamate--tRNA ligase [Rhodocyclaceae bacterium]